MWKSVLPERYVELLNISSTGAYFATWQRFREGDLLDVSTTATDATTSQDVEWRYLARVVRVKALHSRAQSFGVAVRFEQDRLAQAESLPPAPKPPPRSGNL